MHTCSKMSIKSLVNFSSIRKAFSIAFSRSGYATAANKNKYKPDYEQVSILQNASENVKKAYSLEFASKREQNKDKIADIKKQLQIREGDSGSSAVQIGVLTVRIKYLTDHMVHNKKDKSCLRTLLTLVHKRRKMLIYLRKRDFERYHTLLKELTIRPIPDKQYAYIKTKQKQK